MNKILRIGTRDSQLALYQAVLAQRKIEELGIETAIVPIKSAGDLVLNKPLYAFGITGIFTKALDMALLNNEIDLAVHSMKDVPTALPEGLLQAAVLPRDQATDVLVSTGNFEVTDGLVIATGSLRRKAQWLSRYPHHQVVDLRGNINTRLRTLQENKWHGAIFAQAGLSRINLVEQGAIPLDWMIPAPAQGAIVIVARETDTFALETARQLDDQISAICTHVERQFLRTLEGGCTAPIGAYACIKEDTIYFKGGLFSLDGRDKLLVEKSIETADYADFGRSCAEALLAQGGAEIMQKIRSQIQQ